MDGHFNAVRRSEPVEDPAQNLVCSSDDFSFKVASKLDKRFWVRVEREPEGGALVVTDFTPGDRPLAELEAGVSMAARALASLPVRALLFRNLVPSGDQSEGFPVKVVQAADLVKQLGAAVGRDMATSVAGFDLRPRRGKIDAVVTFAGLEVARSV